MEIVVDRNKILDVLLEIVRQGKKQEQIVLFCFTEITCGSIQRESFL